MQETRLEDLVERGRSATGKAAADLVDEATAAPGVLVFGELLDLDGVRALASDPVLAGKLALLRVFAHGTLPEYRADSSLPPLSPAQELKLRRLTVASLAEKSAVLSPFGALRSIPNRRAAQHRPQFRNFHRTTIMRKHGEQSEAERNQQDKRGDTLQTGARQIAAQHACGVKKRSGHHKRYGNCPNAAVP